MRGPLSGEVFCLAGLFGTGVCDLDFDLDLLDSESDDSCEVCFAAFSSPPALGAVFTSLAGLLLLEELECSLAEDCEPDRERDFDLEPERDRDRDRDRDGDLEGVCDTERDRECEAERDVDRDSEPDRERDRDECDESDEEDEERLRELREDTECRLGEVVLCQGSIHSSLGRRELEMPRDFVLGLSFSSAPPSFNSSVLPASFADFISMSTLFSCVFVFFLSSSSFFSSCCFFALICSFSSASFSCATSVSFFPSSRTGFSLPLSEPFSFCVLAFSSRFFSASFAGFFVRSVFPFCFSFSLPLHLLRLSLKVKVQPSDQICDLKWTQRH